MTDEKSKETVVHKATKPTGQVIGTFVPNENFEGYRKTKDGGRGELLGLYKQGKTYWIRAGNDMLMDLCKDWKKKGLITVTMAGG